MVTRTEYRPRLKRSAVCKVCGNTFTTTRSDARYCGATCRQAISRIGRGVFGSSVALVRASLNKGVPYSSASAVADLVEQVKPAPAPEHPKQSLVPKKQDPSPSKKVKPKSVTKAGGKKSVTKPVGAKRKSVTKGKKSVTKGGKKR